jgi:hypothetical protein
MAKIIRKRASKLHAGDTLVVQYEGSAIKHYYHICEIQADRSGVEVKYNLPNGGYDQDAFDHDDIVRVRVT